MIYAMEAEGLLSTKEDYSIEYKSEQLEINGKKQSVEITNKYKKYFTKEKCSIFKKNGELSVNY